MSSYTTRYLTKDEHKEWDELVSQSPASNIFDTTLWLSALSSVLNSDIKILGVFNKGDLIGGVAFNVIKRFGIKTASVPPMSVYNSLHYIPRKTPHIGKQERYIHEITTSIIKRIQDDFHYVVITNHPEFKDIRGFKLRNWRQNIIYSYRICLSKADLSLISPSKRGWVKKARKNLITTEEVKDVKSIYDIINEAYVRQNLKCPLTLYELEGMHKRMGDNIVILATKEQEHGRYTAVYVTLIDDKKDYVYSMFNGHVAKFAGTGSNSLLLWEAIEYFKDRGYKYFDIGEALMLSKASFKSEFSSDIITYYQVSKSNFLFSIAWHLTRGRIARN